MAEQMIFRRYELKYLLNREQYDRIRRAMEGHMIPDPHGRCTNLSLYFDTPDFLLARRSMEHPVYKEKLRIRSYGLAGVIDPVYVELKKKYQKVTYKRRVAMPEYEAIRWLTEGIQPQEAGSQIFREIDYARRLYPGIAPQILLSYDRQAFYDQEDSSFRMTFDRDILWRDTDVDLHTGIFGAPLLERGQVLLEVKCTGAMPLWLVTVLSASQIQRTSFSKYGTAYQRKEQLWLHSSQAS